MTPLADRAYFAAFLDLGGLAALAREFRGAVKKRFADAAARRQFWERVVDGPIGRKALEGAHEEARAMLESELGEGPAEGRE